MVTSHNSSSNKKERVVLVAHYLLYGAAHALRDYLLLNKKTDNLLFITLPLSSQRKASKEVYVNSDASSKVIKNRLGKEKVSDYIIDIFQTCWWIIQERKTYNAFFGFGVLNASVGIFLKKIGIVKRTIFYSIDFVPRRFQNTLLNWTYHNLEIICLRNSDEVWDLSPRMATGREKFLHVSPSLYAHKIVPIGVWNKNINVVPFSRVKKHQVVFIGHLLEKQGVQEVIRAIPAIVKKIPDFNLLIIGGGEYEPALKKLSQELNVQKYIRFAGWIKEREKIDKILGESACAVALYKPEKERLHNFTYYADPTKIKDYLAAGLPIIMTNVSYNAREIEQKQCGFVVEYDSKAIALTTTKFLLNTKLLKVYRQNALQYAQSFDWENIFTKALYG